MKRHFTLFFFLFIVCLPCIAQNPPAAPGFFMGRGGPAGPQIKVTADHNDWNYVPGENAKFIVTGPAGTSISYTIGPEMMPAEKKNAEIPENGTLILDGGTMKEPGFLRCIANAGRSKAVATAGFSPYKIKPTQTEPDDFDEFWDKAKAELAAIPMDVKLTPMPEFTDDKLEAFEVNLQNIGTNPGTTSRFYGVIYIPRGEGPFPAMMGAPGAGVRGPDTDSYFKWGEKGFIVLYIGIHEMPVVKKEGEAPAVKIPGNYTTIGLEDPNLYYFRRVLMGCVRANDYLVSLPKWDKKNLVAAGGSQGGYIAIATTGLDPRVTCCNVEFPGFCDLTGYIHGRAAGWPAFKFDDKNDPLREAKIATTAYYDSVNFARRIKVPGHYGWGYNDDTCTPDSTFAMYNVIDAPKTLTIFKEMDHGRLPGFLEEQWEWLPKHIGITK